jgi:type I restriction modification DNA specificity family protein
MALSQFMHQFFRKDPNGELSDVLIELPKSQVQVRDAKDIAGRYPFFTSGASVLRWDEPLASGCNLLLNTGGNADVKFYVGEMAYSTDTWAITAHDDLVDYAYLLLQAISPELDQKYFLGTGLRHLQKPLLKKCPIYIPSVSELRAFNTVVVPAMTMISENLRENRRLQELRDWLLPMLMNGQATVVSSDKLSFCVDRTTIHPADNAQRKEQFDAMLYLLTESPRINLRGCMRTSCSGLTERRRKVRWCIDSSDQNDDPLAKSHFAVLPREIRSRAHTPTHCSHVSIATSTLS